MTFKEALGVYKNSFCCMTSRIRSQPITAAKAVWKNKNKTKTKTNKKERKKEKERKKTLPETKNIKLCGCECTKLPVTRIIALFSD